MEIISCKIRLTRVKMQCRFYHGKIKGLGVFLLYWDQLTKFCQCSLRCQLCFQVTAKSENKSSQVKELSDSLNKVLRALGWGEIRRVRPSLWIFVLMEYLRGLIEKDVVWPLSRVEGTRNTLGYNDCSPMCFPLWNFNNRLEKNTTAYGAFNFTQLADGQFAIFCIYINDHITNFFISH